jgi:hypothetical protein
VGTMVLRGLQHAGPPSCIPNTHHLQLRLHVWLLGSDRVPTHRCADGDLALGGAKTTALSCCTFRMLLDILLLAAVEASS